MVAQIYYFIFKLSIENLNFGGYSFGYYFLYLFFSVYLYFFDFVL